jgi:hypothetical protein
VSLQECDTGSCEHIINASTPVRARSRQFVTRAVETSVQNFVIVSSKDFDALAGSDIPKSASSIDTASQAVVASEVELTAG